MNIDKRRLRFSEHYLDIFPWVEAVPVCDDNARCKLCKTYINLSILGEEALSRHEKSESHKNYARLMGSTIPILHALQELSSISEEKTNTQKVRPDTRSSQNRIQNNMRHEEKKTYRSFKSHYLDIFPWVEAVPTNNNIARCKLCMICLKLSSRGIATLTGHEKTERHIKNAQFMESAIPISYPLREPSCILEENANIQEVVPDTRSSQNKDSVIENGDRRLVIEDSSQSNTTANNQQDSLIINMRHEEKKTHRSFKSHYLDIFPWVEAVPTKDNIAKCKLCTTFIYLTSGKTALSYHEKTERHKNYVRLIGTKSMQVNPSNNIMTNN